MSMSLRQVHLEYGDRIWMPGNTPDDMIAYLSNLATKTKEEIEKISNPDKKNINFVENYDEGWIEIDNDLAYEMSSRDDSDQVKHSLQAMIKYAESKGDMFIRLEADYS